jgi:hypothetical protein
MTPKRSLLVVICLIPTMSRADPPDSWQEHRRAGFPLEISPHAQPSDTGRYDGGTVGGGAWNWRKAEPPLSNEGTWGWEYTGGLFQRRVFLGWWHGRRYQSGAGAYPTERPRILAPLP